MSRERKMNEQRFSLSLLAATLPRKHSFSLASRSYINLLFVSQTFKPISAHFASNLCEDLIYSSRRRPVKKKTCSWHHKRDFLLIQIFSFRFLNSEAFLKKNMSQGVATAKTLATSSQSSRSIASNCFLPASLLLLMKRNAKSKHRSILTFMANVVVDIQVKGMRFFDQQHEQMDNQPSDF